eukprot:TRINITY_DN1596_c0_g1_i1.p1 TRINITY_DN1596_c0_g1~~TRINITY_DN1596_c0_g1_i1.p1  ORF type:complete len:316 (+),score=85.90 TRINITY_DN1596_c0_g1_i1:177-1124(+)
MCIRDRYQRRVRGVSFGDMQIHEHCHGKSRVRVARRWVDNAGMEHFMELTADVMTYSQATTPSYTEGDNSMVVATDTCKNIAYHVMKESMCTSPEHFAAAYAQKFLALYSFIHRVETTVEEVVWTRMLTDGQPHNHAFSRGSGQERYTANAVAQRNGSLTVESGVRGLSLLKTTRSSWTHFHTDEMRTLGDAHERMLATELTATWRYAELPTMDQFVAIRTAVRKQLLDGFSGPAATGVHSVGVQKSLHDMGQAVLSNVPNVSWLMLNAPNIHFIPAPALAAVGKYKFEDDVFLPTDEPRGNIRLVLTQQPRAKL